MSFSPVGSTTAYQPSSQSLSFDLGEMLIKARTYTTNDDRLFDYIKDILNDRKFQANPKGYLAEWRERRGYTEEYRVPEDAARTFFDKNFKF